MHVLYHLMKDGCKMEGWGKGWISDCWLGLACLHLGLLGSVLCNYTSSWLLATEWKHDMLRERKIKI